LEQELSGTNSKGSGSVPNGQIGRVTAIGDCAKPFAIEPFDPAFQAFAVAASTGNARGDHVLRFTPMEIQFTVSLARSEFSDFADVEPSHSLQ
jgi:hypothetical protein